MQTNKNPNTYTLKSYSFCRLAKGGLQFTTTVRVSVHVPHLNLTLNTAASRSHMTQHASLRERHLQLAQREFFQVLEVACVMKEQKLSQRNLLSLLFTLPGGQRLPVSASGEVSCCSCMPTVHSKTSVICLPKTKLLQILRGLRINYLVFLLMFKNHYSY